MNRHSGGYGSPLSRGRHRTSAEQQRLLLHRGFRLERRDPRDALDLDAAPEAAGALLLRDNPADGIVEPQPQQVALAMILRPILVFAPRMQHDEVVEELDIAAA